MMFALKNHTPKLTNRHGLVAALDVGSSKVCCLIVDTTGEAPRVVGIGHQVSRGLRGGTVVDMEAAENAVRSTVDAAEQMAGETIRSVLVSVSCGHPASQLVAHEVSVAGHEIGDGDLRRILNVDSMIKEGPADKELLHAFPVGYRIDGSRGVRDPRGMYGERLGVNMHLVWADAGPLRNLLTCIRRCHLEVGRLVVAPYASALACLVAEERHLGVTLIDMGGGTTSIAVFFDGELVHSDVIPIGGGHVTTDIARGLSTPLAHAERMKTLYGSVIPSPSDDREIIKVPVIGEEEETEASQVPRSVLVGIIRPRVEETLEMIRVRLKDAGFDKTGGRRLVLTGGACRLPGTVELAGQILDKQARLARPRPLDGLADAATSAAFATCVGMILHGIEPRTDAPVLPLHPLPENRGRLGWFGQWLRENF